MTIEISRGPETSNKWSDKGSGGNMFSIADGVALRGKIAVGPGKSEIEFKIKPEDFAELAGLMAEVDREAAARAFGLALSNHFPPKKEDDESADSYS